MCLTEAADETPRCCRMWCFTEDTSVVRTQYLHQQVRMES